MKFLVLVLALVVVYPQTIFCQPGELDPTFGINGVVATDFSFSKPTSIVIEQDGKILLAGTGGFITRYTSQGSPDSTFGINGTITSEFGIISMAVQSDGKFLVTSDEKGPGPNQNLDFVVARFNSDGTPDKTFSDDGKLTTDYGLYTLDRTRTITVQGDGKIVLTGESSPDFEQSHIRNVIIRYNKDGSLDKTFSGDGKLTTDIGGSGDDRSRNLAIQSDGKMVIVGFNSGNHFNDFAIARYNDDGTVDRTFAGTGLKTVDFGYDDIGVSVALQPDNKIVVSGHLNYLNSVTNASDMCVLRLDCNGSLDSSFSADGKQITIDDLNATYNPYGEDYNNTLAIQEDGKILLAGYGITALVRYNGDGTIDSSFREHGLKLLGYQYNDLAIFDKKLYAVIDYWGIARYQLEGVGVSVNLSIPNNIIKYSSPATIKMNASVANEVGTINKVKFYNGNELLHTETLFPYGFLWKGVPTGTYMLTAKAYDNFDREITSNKINITVVDENVPPLVNIVSPVNDTTYNDPATVRLIAQARDANDKISKVEFYNGTALLITEYIYPYTYNWKNVPPGIYAITAKAYDDKGLSATSEPVKVTVTASLPIVSNKPSSTVEDLNSKLNFNLQPNPTSKILQIYTEGLQQNKPATVLIISTTGVVLKQLQLNQLGKVVQIDLSTFTTGVYTVKLRNGDNELYKRFVKL